jgi:hypothetical protein
MNNPKEFFKTIHPEQFSDSKILRVGKLDRDFFDFYLETLTSKGKEKEFEKFCRMLAEVMICPNLLPQTGPTGGGDSKVDSETYPVADEISSRWYYGLENKGAQERWAFAISAKKDWKPKVKSDVKKIASVNDEKDRGYVKIFFMTNQYVSDKKRADTEDSLRQEFGIDVRIFDRNWILNAVFKDENKRIAIEAFGLSTDFIDEIKIGQKDLRRRTRIDEIEEILKNKRDILDTEIVDIVNESVILYRELEVSEEKMINLLERAEKICKEKGTSLDYAEAVYNSAWTIFWWCDNKQLYYEKYKMYEDIAVKHRQVEYLKNLAILWMNVNVLSHNEESDIDIDIERHTRIVIEEHKKYISDKSKPNASIEARASYQIIRMALQEDVNDIVNEYIDILNNSDGKLNLKVTTIEKIVTDIPLLKEAKDYDQLFEILLDTMGQRSNEIKKAKMLMTRAQDMMDKPYDALVLNSRALTLLLKQETKSELLHSLINMGVNMGQVGCIWAARNFLLYAFCIGTDQYLKFGDVHPALKFSASYLKKIELEIGRVIYASEFHQLHMIICSICDQWPDEKDSETFNYFMGNRILQTNHDKLSGINGLHSYFDDLWLDLAQAAYDYLYGKYDAEILDGFQNDKSRYDDFMQKWFDQKELLVDDEMIFWGIEEKCLMRSKICGCEVEVRTDRSFIAIELGATILASIENFFVTGLRNGVMAITPKVSIEVVFRDEIPFSVDCNNENNIIIVKCSNYNSDEIYEAQNILHDALLEILGYFTAIVFPFDIVQASIEEMVKNDKVFGRTYAFSNNLFHSAEALGSDIFSFSRVCDEERRYDTEPNHKLFHSEEVMDENVTWNNELKELHYGEKPEHLDFGSVSQDNIYIDSIINLNLWNKAGWKGNAYLCIPKTQYPPVLAFIYTSNIGKDIFTEWINDIGDKDIKDRIKIGIIKGIRKDKPFWYRVIVGSDRVPKTGNKELILFQSVNRLHTMEAESHKNIDMFLTELERYPVFQLMPAVIKPGSDMPDIVNGVSIIKRRSSIVVCEAYEIDKNDFFLINAMMPDDDPILPDKDKEYPVMKILEEKRKFAQRRRYY